METAEAELQELLRSAKSTQEPGDPNKVISKGDDNSAPMVVTSLKSAGYSFIWDTETHEKSVTNNNMLPAQLRKKRPDGSRVFTTVDPKIAPTRGALRCMLHPENTDRIYFDSLGLPVCMKSNLTSPFQVKRHMQKRHRQEWETIESEKKEKADIRNVQLQESLIKAAGGQVPEAPKEPDIIVPEEKRELYVSPNEYVSRRKKRK
jgi:hypothetical protein